MLCFTVYENVRFFFNEVVVEGMMDNFLNDFSQSMLTQLNQMRWIAELDTSNENENEKGYSKNFKYSVVFVV